MHNKFAIIDDKILISGSFNWTVAAGLYNQENILVTDKQFYLEEYIKEFDNLWNQFNLLRK